MDIATRAIQECARAWIPLSSQALGSDPGATAPCRLSLTCSAPTGEGPSPAGTRPRPGSAPRRGSPRIPGACTICAGPAPAGMQSLGISVPVIEKALNHQSQVFFAASSVVLSAARLRRRDPHRSAEVGRPRRGDCRRQAGQGRRLAWAAAMPPDPPSPDTQSDARS